MDFQNDINLLISREGINEIYKHAQVSWSHCGCNDCFCCACKNWIADKHQRYNNGKWEAPAPPVCTASWGVDSWVKFITTEGRWL